MLSYWDHNDSLMRSAQSFYYTMPILKKLCNNNAALLECGVFLEGITLTTALLQSVCLDGFHTEFVRFLSDPDYKEFNFTRALYSGFERPRLMHSLQPSDYCSRNVLDDEHWFKKVVSAMIFGSCGDLDDVCADYYLRILAGLRALS